MRADPSELPATPSRRARLICSRPGRCVAVIAPIVLTACQPAVLDPQGIIGIAEKTILIDSLAIMLAIVIPTIAATFAFAWWFRASNTRARYLPDFAYSGRLELIVWAIPLLVIILLGGVAWIGSHDLDPAKPLASNTPPLEVQVRLAGLEVALHLPGAACREREPACGSRRRAHPLLPDLCERDERLLHPAARQHDLHDERHDDAVEPAGGRARHVPRPVKPLQRRWISRTCISTCSAVPAEQFAAWIEAMRKTGPTLDPASYAALAKQSIEHDAVHLPRSRSRAVPADRHSEAAAWTWSADRTT